MSRYLDNKVISLEQHKSMLEVKRQIAELVRTTKIASLTKPRCNKPLQKEVKPEKKKIYKLHKDE